eukprot:scaffold20385_cov121-Isochrysis_galbana.AAC.3
MQRTGARPAAPPRPAPPGGAAPSPILWPSSSLCRPRRAMPRKRAGPPGPRWRPQKGTSQPP